MTARFFLFLSVFFAVVGCKSTKTTLAENQYYEGGMIVEERDLDTLIVSAEKPNNLKSAEEFKLPVHHKSYELKNDIIHTVLDLKFNWEKEQVIGKATITLKPWFYEVDKVVLDAKDFDIHKINFKGQATPLKYAYDRKRITIDLGKTIKQDEEYTLVIDYTAHPAEFGGQGGSEAITSDQGLFFINPRGEEGNKPQQIWTQGETEHNSRWFPTTDKPNERCTQEMYITVEDKYETLSNGVLVSSKKNADGTRTDYWKMNQPHAPYLFMMAVGEFAVIKDSWKGKPLAYYVEPEYKDAAKNIFNHTPEMLSFFSELTGVEYPFDKYSQVVVRDYVSGAMENTTGVIFGDFVQKTNRELIDNHNDGIVAHEMFHHWFGDYVTCESWSNLTMNEGFANYSEYLWFEHKYGKDEADRHRKGEMATYVNSVAQGGAHPLIHFSYADREEMFDAHSYNKGGLVLHMLRNYVGDKAFFASLKKYLNDNAYTAVEAHDLRLAFEEVTGQDLNWFFDQWYFASGHPQLKVSYEYLADSVNITIEQTQNPDEFPAIFVLPFAIDVYDATGKTTRHDVVLDKRVQTFNFVTNGKPSLINIDADNILLAEIQDRKTEEEYVFQFNHAPMYNDRVESLIGLSESSSSEASEVYRKALTDKFWEIRGIAVKNVDRQDPASIEVVRDIAKNDKNSKVRAAALSTLGAIGDKKDIDLMKKSISDTEPYPVVGAALNGLAQMDKTEALAIAKNLEEDTNGDILNAVGEVYSQAGAVDKLAFFEKNWNNLDVYATFAFFENYYSLLSQGEDKTITDGAAKLNAFATNYNNSPWKRFGAIKALYDLSSMYKDKNEKDKASPITIMLNRIKENEPNDQLKMIVRSRF